MFLHYNSLILKLLTNYYFWMCCSSNNKLKNFTMFDTDFHRLFNHRFIFLKFKDFPLRILSTNLKFSFSKMHILHILREIWQKNEPYLTVKIVCVQQQIDIYFSTCSNGYIQVIGFQTGSFNSFAFCHWRNINNFQFECCNPKCVGWMLLSQFVKDIACQNISPCYM